MTYRIKTAARLTGIPRNTLLAWERRYQVVEPDRAENGYRIYSDDDIARLNAVRQLLDQGYKVSEAVRLLQSVAGEEPAAVVPEVRVAVVHPGLVEQLRTAHGAGGAVQVVAAAERWADLDLSKVGEVDILLISLDRLGAEPRRNLQAALQMIGAEHAVVLYNFAQQHVLQRLVAAGVRLLREPVRARQVVAVVREVLALARTSSGAVVGPQGPPPPIEVSPVESRSAERRFDDLELARLAELQASVSCECPNHLAGLVRALVAFEAYSEQCASDSPDDRALHGWLSRNTSRARRVVEEMLYEVALRDGVLE